MTMSTILANSFKVTALASALALAGCGGGGADNPNDSVATVKGPWTAQPTSVTNPSTSTDTTTAQKLANVKNVQVVSDNSSFYMNNGETITLTAYALDNNNIGVSGVPVNLQIPTPSQTGIFSSTPQNLTTDETGKATITLDVKSLSTEQKDFLRKTGLNVSVTVGGVTATKTLKGSDAKPSTTTTNNVTTNDLVLISSASTIPMAVGNKVNVTAVALDKDNNVIANKAVTFKLTDKSADTGLFPNGSLTAITNEKGEATVEFEIKSLTEAQKSYLATTGVSLTAEVDGKAFDDKITIKGVDASTATTTEKFNVQAINLTTPTPIYDINVGNKITVTASVLNDKNTGIGGVPVVFEIEDPATTGVYAVSNTSNVITNEKGEATIELEVKSNEFKDKLIKGLKVTATAQNTMANTPVNKTNSVTITGKVVDTSTNTADVVSKVESAILSSPTTEFDLAVGTKITVTASVADANRGSLANVPVQFTLPSLDSTGIVSLSNSIVNTNAQGQATIELEVKSLNQTQRDNLKNGLIINASVPNSSVKTNTLKLTPKTTAEEDTVSSISVTADSTSILMAKGTKVKVTAIALDTHFGGLKGKTLNFTIPNPTLTGVFNITGSSVVTDDKGEATIELEVKSDLTQPQKDELAKGLKVTVTEPNAKTSGELSLTGEKVSQEIVNAVTLTSNVQSIPLTVGSQFTVTATVSDANNGGIANAPVTFTVPSLADYGVVNLSGSSVTTNAQGLATITLQIQSLTDAQKAKLVQGFTIKAASNGKNAPELTLKATDSQNIEAYKLFISPSKTTLRTSSDTTTLGIKVTDVKGGIKAGVPVKLEIVDGLDKGITFDKTSNLVTDTNGYVEVNVIQNNVGLISKLDHTASIKVLIDDGIYKPSEQRIDLNIGGTTIKDGLVSKAIITDNDTVTVSGTAVDGNNSPIINESIQLMANGNPLTIASVKTDSQGKFSFTVSSNQLGTSTNNEYNLQARITNGSVESQPYTLGNITKVTASALNLTITQNSQSVINNELKVGTPATVTVDLPTTVANGTIVYLTTNKGTIDDNKTRVSAVATNGQVSFNNVQSTSPGEATLTVEYNGTKQLEKTITYITNDVAKLSTQVTNSTVSINGVTTVIATVRDSNDAPVKNALVEFSTTQDSSGGRLSSSTALTDAAGNATVTYYAGQTSTPINGVTIQSTVKSVKLGNEYLAVNNIQTQRTSFTVQSLSAWIGFGFADRVSSSENAIYYTRNGSIFINNSIGQPAANQEVSIAILPKTYGIGLWKFIPSVPAVPATTDKNGNVISPAVAEKPAKWIRQVFYLDNGNAKDKDGMYNCQSEDVNSNTILDAGEDYNGDNQLTPLNPITVLDANGTAISSTQTVKTDATGKLDFTIRYGKEYANWMTATVRVTTKVDGSEFSQTRDITLPVLDTDVTTQDSNHIRPNTISPFGTLMKESMNSHCSFIENDN